MRIHHVGYMVKNIKKAIETFKMIGFAVEKETVFDEYRGIDICFMVMDGYRIELVASHNEHSVIYKLQKKMGNSPYHICYEVDNLFGTLEALRENNFVVLQEPREAIAIGKRKVVFLFDKQLGLIELLEGSAKEKMDYVDIKL